MAKSEQKSQRIIGIEQRVAAEILTQFMFTKDMDEASEVWNEIFKQYNLCIDPFTSCPCTPEEYYIITGWNTTNRQ